jgi:hypothetical protein
MGLARLPVAGPSFPRRVSHIPHIRQRPEPPGKTLVLATPSDVYSKLLWELGNLKGSGAEEALHDELAYHAYNFAVTAWHLIDWVWTASDDNLRTCISGFFEGATISKMQHLTKAIAGRYRTIHVCGQIANGSKHYIADRTDDPAIEAKAPWMTHRRTDRGSRTKRPW